LLIAVTVTVTLCPAGSMLLSGLTLRPGAVPGVTGTVIVNVTGPPCAVSVKVALEFGSGSRTIVVDTSSVPGAADGDGDGAGDRDGDGEGERDAAGPGVRAGTEAGEETTAGAELAGRLAGAAGDSEPAASWGDGEGASGAAVTVAAGCAVAPGGPPPCRSIAAAVPPPAAMMTMAAAAA
jgi:hypothetical protein